jgi:pimeloyl-ACP methyl ester carboxylesterase
MQRIPRLPIIVGCLLGTWSATAQFDYPVFDWHAVKPSSSLIYHDCFGEFKCARLEVPLDWQDTSNTVNNTVSIAILKLPAIVPDSDPSFGGSIITNPGGPGGSGVYYVLREGNLIRGLVDGRKKYEIVSFDPRGVGFSTPLADCYGNLVARRTALLETRALGAFDENPMLGRHYARIAGWGKLCGNIDIRAGKSSILKHLSTAAVARDMVEIVDRIEELRDKEFVKENLTNPLKMDIPRIQYLGFSYGTVLGNYFASMFPGRVGRMILDAVVDSQDYAEGVCIYISD